MLTPFASERRSFSDDHPFHDSPSSGKARKHVVLVMNGMTEFDTQTLQWTLDNVVTAGCIVTLLGVMPWLNIPLFLKTRNDFWMVELEDVAPLMEKHGTVNDVKNPKRQEVMPQKKIAMGYPKRLRVVDQIRTLCPTWVVFDRYHRRNKDFYARKIPCNILMMSDDGKFDMVKSRMKISNGESTPTHDRFNVPEEFEDDDNCRKCVNF
ncbi:hypothetical protein L6164_027384 [Bauhinia variegata]|uniref:Uncharacterized protein n=1 Tax=Bauhinia variegata TaxID=167791 RepID=A0ACB9LTC8_BAUVA|nr:hypothetical protein L6164_027384 [Bauhinia variegata]